nr:uncharacterized protein LOC122172315 isoform X2 [Chrysemys picta bellii]
MWDGNSGPESPAGGTGSSPRAAPVAGLGGCPPRRPPTSRFTNIGWPSGVAGARRPAPGSRAAVCGDRESRAFPGAADSGPRPQHLAGGSGARVAWRCGETSQRSVAKPASPRAGRPRETLPCQSAITSGGTKAAHKRAAYGPDLKPHACRRCVLGSSVTLSSVTSDVPLRASSYMLVECLRQIRRRLRRSKEDMFRELLQSSDQAKSEHRAWRETINEKLEMDSQKRRQTQEQVNKAHAGPNRDAVVPDCAAGRTHVCSTPPTAHTELPSLPLSPIPLMFPALHSTPCTPSLGTFSIMTAGLTCSCEILVSLIRNVHLCIAV